ncbi:MAG: hypothetical protein JWM58_3313 [Rhizobium sp.]|nr:hypothetical protein [Rhizobium sp.]
MKPSMNPILVGIVAGLAAAILMAGSVYLPLVLQLIAITALFIAGLGFGRVAGLVAVATAAIALGALTSSVMGAAIFGVMLLPAAVMSHLASLARPASEIGGPDTALAWYPLSDILLAGAVLTALATVFLLLLQPTDTLYAIVVEEVSRMFSETNPSMVLTPEAKAQAVRMLRVFGPISQGIGNMLLLFAGFYFAMRMLTAMGRSVRPREDIRASLRMNRLSIAVFLAGIALMFAGDRIAVVGASFAGAVAGGFLLSGFAIIHNALRDKSWALPSLILVYLVTLIFPPLTIVIAIAGGLANPRRAIALSPNEPDQTPTNQS